MQNRAAAALPASLILALSLITPLNAANECGTYPTQIDARLFYTKRTINSEPVIGYVHTIPAVENLQMEWYRPSESALDPIPSEDWFPLLGDLFEVEAQITIELIGQMQLSYFSAGLPVTWPIGDTGLYYHTAHAAQLAVLDLDFQINLPHGIGWVDFEASPSDPQTPPLSEINPNNVLSDRYVGVGDFLPRAVRADGTPVDDFEPRQYWDRQVTVPPGPFTYDGAPDGGEHPAGDFTAFLSSRSNLRASSLTLTFPTPSVATDTILAARISSSSRPSRMPSAISEIGEATWADAGDILSGSLKYWPSLSLTQRYTPKTSAAYARDLAVINGLPPGDQMDALWRKNYADRIWDYTIRLRSTSSETSGYNLALRDAEYFWRGVAGGYSRHTDFTDFFREVFVDPVNTVANNNVDISTPVYNGMKELLLLIGVKSTVPVEDAAILERMFDGKAGYSLAGTPGEGLATAYAPTMRGFHMGLAFHSPATIQSRLEEFIANGGCFPDLSPGEILFNPETPLPLQRSLGDSPPLPLLASRSDNPPRLLPLDAYIDTLTEARISQRYFVRETGMNTPLDFSFPYQSGGLTLPDSGGGGGGSFSPGTELSPVRTEFSGAVITRGSLAYSCMQDRMVSVTVTGPFGLSAGAVRIEFGSEVHFIRPGIAFDLNSLEPGGVNNFVIAGLDGPALENQVFNIQIETAGQQAAILSQTAFYVARPREADSGIFVDSDGDGIDDRWETDHYGNLARASASSNEDGDRLPLIAEFWLGGDPTQPDDHPPVHAYRQRGDSSTEEWAFTFERREFGTDRYIVETSPDLIEWSTAYLSIDERDADQSGVAAGFFRALVRIPKPSEPSPTFVRVRVWGSDQPPGGGGG